MTIIKFAIDIVKYFDDGKNGQIFRHFHHGEIRKFVRQVAMTLSPKLEDAMIGLLNFCGKGYVFN
jgi:hypothetical protein